jgi:MOSC domain-containing protein YiiM
VSGRIGTLVSINSSAGGVPKRPVLLASVNLLGLEDDRHVDRNHGGPDRAICLYSVELIKALRQEGHPIDVGTAGENFTVEDLDWSLVVPGARIAVGAQVQLEITSFTTPCKTIAASFSGGAFKRISEKLHPGWSRVYAKVVTTGTVESGSSIIIE